MGFAGRLKDGELYKMKLHWRLDESEERERQKMESRCSGSKGKGRVIGQEPLLQRQAGANHVRQTWQSHQRPLSVLWTLQETVLSDRESCGIDKRCFYL